MASRSRRSSIEAAAGRLRDELIRLERAQARQLGQRWRPSQQRLESEITDLARAIVENAAKQDTPITRSWLSNEARWRQFEQLLQRESTLFGEFTIQSVRAAQWEFAGRAIADANKLIGVAAGGADLAAAFDQVPVEATVQIVGQLQRNSPLMRLPGIGRPREVSTMADQMGRALIRGVTRGASSARIARDMARSTNIPLQRALTISRTESLRAHREGARYAYEESSAVSSWRWVAVLEERTCSACWAMNGQIFDTDVAMGCHPNCRCTMAPVLSDEARELAGVGPDDFQTGEEAFAAAGADVQRSVLGPEKYAAYRDGRIKLVDTVRTSTSRHWGVTRTTASLEQALARAG